MILGSPLLSDKNAIYLWIQAKDNATPVLKNINEQVRKIEKTGKAGSTGLAGINNELRHMVRNNRGVLMTFQLLRVAIFRMTAAAAMIGAPFIAGFKSINDFIMLNAKVGRELGMSAEELSKKLYGVKITDEDIRRVEQFKTGFGQAVQYVKGLTIELGTGTLAALEKSLETLDKIPAKIKKSMGSAAIGMLKSVIPAGFLVPSNKMYDDMSKGAKEAHDEARKLVLDAEIDMLAQLTAANKQYTMSKYQLELQAIDKETDLLKTSLNRYADSLEKKDALDIALEENRRLRRQDTLNREESEYKLLQAKLERMAGNTVEAQKIEYEIQYENMKKSGDKNLQVWEEYYSKVQGLERLHTMGLRSHTENWTQSVQGFTSAATTGFSRLFELGFQGKLRDARQAFDAFIMALNQSIIQFLAKETTRMLFSGAFNMFFPGGGGGGALGAGAGIKMFASGGVVTKPTLGIVGEAGPEAVIPLNKLNTSPQEKKNVTININAIDSKSFVELLSQNSQVITNIFSESIIRNSSARRVLRKA